MTENPVIRIENASYSYRTEPVLRQVTLDIIDGDYLGIIGPNGGGKTTLLKLILGLVKPATGRIELFGRPVGAFREWSRIGYVPQKAAGIKSGFPFTVEEVVAFGLAGKLGMFRRPRAAEREAVAGVLEQVSMLPHRSSLVTELSGGQQQRVFIAKSLVSRPRILILDEPTVGVDVQSQDEFYSLLRLLNQDGITLVLVSHDIDVIANEVKTIACLNQTLICHNTPGELIKGDYLERLYGHRRTLILHGH